MLVRRLAPVAVVFALSACGGVASAAAPKASPTPQRFRGAAGQLVKITGTTLVLSGTAGDTTVVYDSNTRIERTSTAGVGDITPGICLVATGQKDATGAVTATTVRIFNAVNGGCSVQRGAADATPAPGARFGGARVRPTPPPNFAFAAGIVTAVNGTQVSLTPMGQGASSVTIPTTVRISKTVPAGASDLQIGECLAAAGRRDQDGTVHATSLTITPPNASGTCGARGAFGGGGGFFFGPGGSDRGAGG